MGMLAKQPEVRHNKQGPFSDDGICYLPKVLTFKKDNISGTSNNDFWTAPTGVLISRAFLRMDIGMDGSGTAELGTDSNIDALIDTSDYVETTAGNNSTNIGSTNADNPEGLYLDAGDVIRLTIAGSPTVGAVSGFIEYYELDSMMEQGVHFDIE
jgi:hypothetical protein